MSHTAIIAIIITALLIAAFMFTRRGGGAPRIDAGLARTLITQGALLLDVRTPQEFAAGHIRGARNIPVQSLASRLGELERKDQAIIVYCRSGQRSGSAGRILIAGGFEEVHDLGAMSSW